MKIVATSSVFMAIILFLSGCTKKNDPTPATNTNMISRTWIVQNVNLTGGNKSLMAYTKGSSANLVDFTKFSITFSADGKESNTDQNGITTTGTWKFLNNETQIQITNSDNTIQLYDVSSITSSSCSAARVLNQANVGTDWSTLLKGLVTFGGFDPNLTSVNMNLSLIAQ